ncbi:SDR family NAD(P)-dependent oxidoreductase [Terricaulis silvestris]|uniref:D-xylose 1-dehydrogenase n=1 Tax=Terricaulis silvestris TaxID=2686094 RepID=A0A6I6MTP9_9CAUL|nr:SDR family oxidoreductase [Terricaulis silvestris]QGZ96157.1 2-dehydro-3-deoxy-D-gluconate 5-dehydrogenase [Terricaulis silvestris]
MSAMDWSNSRGVLNGRVAIVTGAGGGIGRGLACALALAGARVVIAARRRSTGEETAELVCADGGEALVVETDVAQRPAIDALIEGSVAAYGGIDIVIHNASSALSGKAFALEDVNDENWDEQCGTALGAAFHLAQASFPHLRDSGRGRFIIFTSSQGLHGGAMNPVYAATKNAQRGFAKALAREWGPHGITVNAVAPAALTDGARHYLARDPERSAQALASFPLGRMGDMRDDIGAMVVAMCSDYWRYVTGQVINADGGYYTAL